MGGVEDIGLVEEELEKLQNVVTVFKGGCEGRKLKLNVAKSKVMTCCKENSLGGAEINVHIKTSE